MLEGTGRLSGGYVRFRVDKHRNAIFLFRLSVHTCFCTLLAAIRIGCFGVARLWNGYEGRSSTEELCVFNVSLSSMETDVPECKSDYRRL